MSMILRYVSSDYIIFGLNIRALGLRVGAYISVSINEFSDNLPITCGRYLINKLSTSLEQKTLKIRAIGLIVIFTI